MPICTYFENDKLVIRFRHDMIACLGETTGLPALRALHQTMATSEEGARILASKPRINSRTIDLDALDRLPENSFGYQYKQFLRTNVISVFASINVSNPLHATWVILLERDARQPTTGAVCGRCPAGLCDDPLSRMSRSGAHRARNADDDAGRG